MQQPILTNAGSYAANFGASLRERRVAAGLSQREVAERAAEYGVRLDPTAVTRVERGERDVRLGEAFVLAHLVGASPTAMVTRDPMTSYHEQEVAVRRALISARASLVEALHHLVEVRAELEALPPAIREQEWTPDEWPGYMAREVVEVFERDVDRMTFAPSSPAEASGARSLVQAVVDDLLREGR